jgi:hypothetical protein
MRENSKRQLVNKMWGWCWCLLILELLAHKSVAVQVDCVANDFSLAPGAELPYAYRAYTTSLSWNTSRQYAQLLHPDCDLAVVRNQATLAHLQNLGYQKMQLYTPGLTCGGFWMGLRQVSTNFIPQGGWYWTDDVYFDPWNTSDSRWNSVGSSLPQFGLGNAAWITYGSTCNSWMSWNESNLAWSLWEIPSKHLPSLLFET